MPTLLIPFQSGVINSYIKGKSTKILLIGLIVNNKAKLGKAFGTIKMHKEGNLLRLITSCFTSCCGTAIENLSAFTKFLTTAMGPKNACSYAVLAMGIIDQTAKSGETKPKLWRRYRDDIFDLWTQGTTKLKDFTEFINSLYPIIKFTMVSSEISLKVLDLTLLLVDEFVQTDIIYCKPTDHHIYLVCNSAHPSHCTRAIPFGVATTVRRNCSTIEKFEERNKEYQNYIVDCRYHRSKVKTQFDKAKDTPREDLLSPKEREKKVIFPLVVNLNPHLPNISKIIESCSHFIYDSPTLAQIFLKGSIIPCYRRVENIKELLVGPKGSNCSNNDHSATGCFKCSKKCDLCKNFLKENKIFYSACTDHYYTIRQHLDCKSKNVIYLGTCKKCRLQYVGSILPRGSAQNGLRTLIT